MKTKIKNSKSKIALNLVGNDGDIIKYEEIKSLFDYFIQKDYKVFFEKYLGSWIIKIRKGKEGVGA